VLPALTDMLNEGLDQGDGMRGARGARRMARRGMMRRGRHGHVTETFIFMRRTVHY
jgi:hypothetical protein